MSSVTIVLECPKCLRGLNSPGPLNQQCETTLATEVRQFAQHLPKVLTDRERLAVQFARFFRAKHRQTAELDWDAMLMEPDDRTTAKNGGLAWDRAQGWQSVCNGLHGGRRRDPTHHQLAPRYPLRDSTI